MKKYVHFFALALIFMLLTGFIIQSNASFTDHNQSILQTTGSSKMGFWTKAALFGSAVGGYAVMRRYRRRHFGGGLGCLGILLAIIIAIAAIVLLPIILVVGVVLLACGVTIRSPRWRHRRRRW
jgi:K+-transporting ATPase A subunit